MDAYQKIVLCSSFRLTAWSYENNSRQLQDTYQLQQAGKWLARDGQWWWWAGDSRYHCLSEVNCVAYLGTIDCHLLISQCWMSHFPVYLLCWHNEREYNSREIKGIFSNNNWLQYFINSTSGNWWLILLQKQYGYLKMCKQVQPLSSQVFVRDYCRGSSLRWLILNKKIYGEVNTGRKVNKIYNLILFSSISEMSVIILHIQITTTNTIFFYMDYHGPL